MDVEQKFDLIVIGSGPGGYVAAIRAAQLGLKVACVEKEKYLGGTCLNVGCIPSKALLQSTEHLAWMQHNASEHGIICHNISSDFLQMMRRKEKVVEGLTTGIGGLFKKNHVTRILGMAKFISPNQIEVHQNQTVSKLSATSFILATGSEPISLPFLPFNEQNVVSSTGALNLKTIPEKMIVIGGGVIGVELASVYQRLGSKVIIIEMLDQICTAMDAEISQSLLRILKKQDVEFRLGAKVTQAKMEGQIITLKIQSNEFELLSADVVLIAVGRRPYTTGLGLPEMGITLSKQGFVPVDNHFRTCIPHIYAIGDVIEGPMLAHRASEEGVVVAELLAGTSASVNYMAIPNVIYTHPEAASVGLTEAEAKKAGLNVVVGNVSFRGNARARAAGDMEGFVKVVALNENKKLIGMHILGPQASELIHTGMLAIEKGASLQELASSPFGHPTLSESIKEACKAALGQAVH